MSTKQRPPSAKRAAALAAAAEILAKRRFAQRLYGTLAILALLAGGLSAANVAKLPRPNATSALLRSSAPAAFSLYTLERDPGKDAAGAKKPDTIRGANLTGGGEPTTIASAPRIQEFAALPSALAVVTLNEDNTSALEVVPLAGGPATLVPLPGRGTVENLRAAGAGHLVGFTFTASSVSEQYRKTLFVYDIDSPSSGPRAVQGISGNVSAADWRFVPGTTKLVAQTDDRSLFLLDALGAGKVSPLGTHAGILGIVPGTNELAVSDPGLQKGIDPPRYSTINLATGALTPLALTGTSGSGALTNGATTTAAQPVILDSSGKYVQVVSNYDAGKETAVVNLSDKGSPRQLYKPAAEWSSIQDVCTDPTGNYLAVETSAPQYIGDQYPVRPEPTPMRTDLVDLKSGTVLKSLPGSIPSWCS
ncbi:MAG TPA: hypothetical protein VJP90_09090 [Paenarthrobacter sp.]|nr:hypothetical protein [Paenarthrobacter sp.]